MTVIGSSWRLERNRQRLEGKQSGRLDGVLEPNIALKVFLFFTVLHKQAEGV
jgi:hypothetical protein